MTFKGRAICCAVAIALPLGTSFPAQAQSDYVMSPVQFPSSFSLNAMTQIGKVYEDPAALGAGTASDTTAVASATFSFSPSAARRQANLAAFVEKARKADPQGAADMEHLFRTTNVIGDIDRSMRATFGLRADDVADAYAVWWMNSWQAAHGDFSDPSRHKAQAVRTQVANALAATPLLMSADNSARQELAESLLIQTALIGAAAEGYANDSAMMRQLGTSVRQGARTLGVNLDAITLTEEGFVPAR